MSSIDINKLIQESISNRPVGESKDPEAGLEDALQGVEEKFDPIRGHLPNKAFDPMGGVQKHLNARAALAKTREEVQNKMKTTTAPGPDVAGLGPEGMFAGVSKEDIAKKAATQGSAWDTVKGLASNPKVQAGAAIGGAAIGAGYAAKKYLQRRKAKKAGRR